MHGIPWREWLSGFPELDSLAAAKPIIWQNHITLSAGSALTCAGYTAQDVEDASLRVDRFAPLMAVLFPQTAAQSGIMESPLREAPKLFESLQKNFSLPSGPRLFLKLDNDLPVGHALTGRGGIYEVLRLAEELAMAARLLKWSSDYRKLAEPDMRDFFGNFTIAVASMGNQAMAVGRVSSALGFQTRAHLPAGSPPWKKSLLKAQDVELVEHQGNYEETLKEARERAVNEKHTFFIDSEYSRNIFLGYATACARLKHQLDESGITVDNEHPLNVYMPCGLGDGPAGICFGLKLIFRDNIRFYTAEPVHSPAMPLALGTRLFHQVSVYEIGLDPAKTIADELATGRVSGPTCYVMRELLDGCVTVTDDDMLGMLALAHDAEQLRLEPSAMAGLAAMNYVLRGNLSLKSASGTHIAWITSGNLMPDAIWQGMYDKGKASLEKS